jgi:hypothetical protein
MASLGVGPSGRDAFGPYGNLFIAESILEMVREVSGYTGVITTIAGFPTAGPAQDGSLAAEQDGPSLGGVYGIAADMNGNLYFADARNNRICMLARSGAAQRPGGKLDCGVRRVKAGWPQTLVVCPLN